MDQIREAIYYRQGIGSLFFQKSKEKWYRDEPRYAPKDREGEQEGKGGITVQYFLWPGEISSAVVFPDMISSASLHRYIYWI